MYISTLLGNLMSLVSELSVMITVESYFRCCVGKNFCHDEICLIFGCVILGPVCVSICVLLLILLLGLLFGSPFYFYFDLMDATDIMIQHFI